MAEEYKISLGAELSEGALNALQSQISDLSSSIKPIKIKLDTSNIDSQINTIKTKIEELSKIKIDLGAGKTKNANVTVNQTAAAYKELISVANQIDKLSLKIGGMKASAKTGVVGLNVGELNKAQESLRNLYATYQDLHRQLSQGGLNDVAFKQLKQDISDTKSQLTSLESTLTATQSKLVTSIKTDIKTGSLGQEIDGLQSKFNAVKVESEDVSKNIEKLRSLMSRMDSSDDIESVVADYKEFEQILKTTSSQITNLQQSSKTKLQSQTLSNEIQTWMNNNTKAAERFDGRLKVILDDLNKNTDPTALRNARLEFAKIKSEAKGAGLVTSSFATSLKQTVLQVAGLTSAATVFYKVVRVIKQGVDTVKELDTALVDLRKTTTMSASELSQFYYEANEIAKEYGQTTQSIIQSAADWSRMGYGSKEAASQMSKLAAQFSVISPGLDVENATTGLVSVMKAYGVDVENVLDGIMSKINIVGNTAATTNAEIITGLQKSAAALSMTGSSLEDNIALFAAGQEIVQNSEQVGNALRSMAMRIRGYDEETNELSDDLVNITGQVIDLTKAASNNNQGISLFTDASQTKFKNLGQYLKEIAEVYDELDAKTQQNLLEKLFGKTRASVGAAIIKNIDGYSKALDNMANSAGNADAEMRIAQDSIEFKMNQLGQTWVGIAQDIFQSKDLKNLVSSLTSISEVIQGIVKWTGALPPILATIVGYVSATKNFGRIEMFILNSKYMPKTIIVSFGYESFKYCQC